MLQRPRTDLTYEEYAHWCRSRFPEEGEVVEEDATSSRTLPVSPVDGLISHPVTLRSSPDDRSVVTPKPKRSI